MRKRKDNISPKDISQRSCLRELRVPIARDKYEWLIPDFYYYTPSVIFYKTTSYFSIHDCPDINSPVQIICTLKQFTHGFDFQHIRDLVSRLSRQVQLGLRQKIFSRRQERKFFLFSRKTSTKTRKFCISRKWIFVGNTKLSFSREKK